MLNRLRFLLITALPALLFFFFLIPNADAASTYTIYAYGSGYIMVGILKSIASVVASGGFSLILKSVVLVGFVIIFLQMIITSFKVSPHRSLVKYFSAVLVIYSALLIPKVNVNVYDTVNNTTSNAVVVSNVPWGIGAIASYFSEFQYYMTTSIEQAFSTPQTVDLTNAGMGFALTSQNMVDGVQIDDPYLFQSFTQYVYNCVLPGISAGGLSSQALTQAGMSVTGTGDTTNSLLGYMASYTDGAGANLLTTEYSRSDPSGVTTTCGTQTGDIQTSFTNYATNDAGPQIAGALGMTYATFANEYGLVNSSIYSMSSNAEQEIIQMMAVNQYSQAMIQSANLAGVNPTQLAYGSALAQQNMSGSFSISGQMAGKYMPVVYSIFSALFLAFSLFLIILMALPIGVNYLKMYMELGLFLAVWPALMAVYNYIIDLIIQQQFSYLAGQGYSLNSAHTVNTFIATQLGWMGYLSWGVPMMAYALVTGSTYAMVGAISSMDSAGKKASGAAAAQAASGNVNLGNDSLSNYNANKLNSESMGTMGQGGLEVINTTPFGQRKSTFAPGQFADGGNPTFSDKKDASNQHMQGGVEIQRSGPGGANSIDVTKVTTPNVTASSVNQQTATDQESLNKSTSKTDTTANNLISTLQSTTGSGSVRGTQKGSSIEAGANAKVINAEKLAIQRLAEKYHQNTATITAALGFSAEKFGFTGGVDSKWANQTGNRQAVANTFASDVSKDHSFQSGIKTLQGISNNTTLSSTASDIEGKSRSFSTANSKMTTAQKNLAESKNLSEALSHNGVATYLNHKNAQWKGEGLSNEQIKHKQDQFVYDFNQGIGNAQQEVSKYNANKSGLIKDSGKVSSDVSNFTDKVNNKLNKAPKAVGAFYKSNKAKAERYFNSGQYGDVKNKVQSLKQIARLRKQDRGLKKIQGAVGSRLALAQNVKASELNSNITKDLQNNKWVAAHPEAAKAAENIIGNKALGQHNPAGVAQYKALRNAGVLKSKDVVNNISGFQKLQTKIGSQLSSNRAQITKDSNIGQSVIGKNIPNVAVKKPAMAAINKNTATGKNATTLAAVVNTGIVIGAGAVGGALLNPAPEVEPVAPVPDPLYFGSR